MSYMKPEPYHSTLSNMRFVVQQIDARAEVSSEFRDFTIMRRSMKRAVTDATLRINLIATGFLDEKDWQDFPATHPLSIVSVY